MNMLFDLLSPHALIAELHNMNAPYQNQSPSEEEITVCAYLIWEDEGRPEGLDKIHWGQAEMQLPVCLVDE